MAADWRYVPDAIVGRGASGTVWRARDNRTDEVVALKVATSPAAAAWLAAEAETLLLVESAHIPPVLGFGVVPSGVDCMPAGAAYLVSRWAPGRSVVPTEIAERDREALSFAIARDVGAALDDLHQAGVGHGDVKPANMMVSDHGDGFRVALIDLGLSSGLDMHAMRGGTSRYLPPEVSRGVLSARGYDLWALGLVMAECMNVRVASAEDPVAVLRELRLPAPFDRWCCALTATDPGARPSAGWVCASARALQSKQGDNAETEARRVRAAYLRVRRDELHLAARASEVSVGEGAVSWLSNAVDIVRATAEVGESRRPTTDSVHLAPLDSVSRARWLVALVGASAASWPLDGVIGNTAETEFARVLTELASRRAPRSWTVRDVRRALEDGKPSALDTSADRGLADDVDLALALARRPAEDWAIAQAEGLASACELSERHGVLLAGALRDAGELGRALIVLEGRTDAAAVIAHADLLRRSGAGAAADRLARELIDHPDWSDAARAIVARVMLDGGQAEAALQAIGDARGAAAHEVRALILLGLGRTSEALLEVEQGLALSPDDATRSRLLCVRGMEAHARGAASESANAFGLAVDDAVRAGAVLEEATYRTGAAAAAVDAGRVGQALVDAGRAALLWEHLRRPAKWAYALLARASAFTLVGAAHDAEQSARAAVSRAHEAGDRRAEAYATWVLSDSSPAGTREAQEHAAGALALLGHDGLVDDVLRAQARVLRGGGLTDVEVLAWDSAALGASATACCDWWGARAAAWSRGRKVGRQAEILGQLMRLVRAPAPVGTKGPALHAALELAANSGDGGATRLLASAHAKIALEVLEHVPVRLRDGAARVPWLTVWSGWTEPEVTSDQARDLERLVRALGTRDNLRRLLEQVLDALVLWTGVERGLLLLRAPDDRLVVRAARNLARDDLRGEQLTLSQSLAHRALSTGEPVVAVDAAGELADMHHSVHALGLRSVLAVPLLARGEALGVAYLDDRVRRGAFGPQELAWVKLVAGIAAVAIADARAHLLLRREARRAKRAQETLAASLAEREAALGVAEQELARARRGRRHRHGYDAIVGESVAVHEMLDLLDRLIPTSIPVLICGESGSGKELVARALHDKGPRSRGSFVSENCSAIPEPLFEATLFGHVRGAFTGADRARIGLFEAADGGTLFLDEIGDLPPQMQSKLLRTLQDGEVHPLGAPRSRRVDVRVLAATNRDLDVMVKEGRFREDLLYRLNVITVRVPALRERLDDVPLLVRHFLAVHAEGVPARVSAEAMSRLSSYAWPGNVRQLENEVRRALILSDGAIRPEHLTEQVRGVGGTNGSSVGLNLRSRVDALERELVSEALVTTRGNQTRAARALGVSRYGLQKMIKRLGITSEGHAAH